MRLETIAVHAGHEPDPVTGAVTPAIHLSTTFEREPDHPTDAPSELLAALGVVPSYVGRSRFDYLLAVDSESTLRAIEPDFRQLATVDCRVVIVTALSARAEFDFVSRFFAPASGIDQDSW